MIPARENFRAGAIAIVPGGVWTPFLFFRDELTLGSYSS
jgi:hypothetical protein